MQENDRLLLDRINTADELPDHIIKELQVSKATVTPWWWGLKTLLKVMGGWIYIESVSARLASVIMCLPAIAAYLQYHTSNTCTPAYLLLLSTCSMYHTSNTCCLPGTVIHL